MRTTSPPHIHTQTHPPPLPTYTTPTHTHTHTHTQVELAQRLLPAFNTPSGVPSRVVHLQNGIPRGRVRPLTVAEAGSLQVELRDVSRASGEPPLEPQVVTHTLLTVVFAMECVVCSGVSTVWIVTMCV